MKMGSRPPLWAIPARDQIRSTKSEIRRNLNGSNSKFKKWRLENFLIRVWDFLRASDFGFRIYTRGTPHFPLPVSRFPSYFAPLMQKKQKPIDRLLRIM